MRRQFVIISGLPGSGKSTLARPLAVGLNLQLLDKDDILDALFESKGLGEAAWRRRLSRESDVRLQTAATISSGAVLVSFWHVEGMPKDAGTPSGWLSELSNEIVNVHCDCPPEIAARRFLGRNRHNGHLDRTRSEADVLESLRILAGCDPLDVGTRVIVNTSQEPNLDDVIVRVRQALAAMAAS